MQFVYSELITRFKDLLGTQKELVEETFNKPDATDIVMNRCVSIRKFGDFHLLIVFEMNGQVVRFLSAYRVYPKLMNGMDIGKMKPIEVLTEFMNRYGVSKQIPGLGERKILFERAMRVFFPGILDIEKYLGALKNL